MPNVLVFMIGRCTIALVLAGCTTHVHPTTIERCSCACPTVKSLEVGEPEHAIVPRERFIDTPTGPVTAKGSPVAADLDDRPRRPTPPRARPPVDPDDFPKLKPYPGP